MESKNVREFEWVKLDAHDVIKGGTFALRLALSKYFEVNFDRSGQIRLQAKGFVGRLDLSPSISINVTSRVPANLDHLMRVSGVRPTILPEMLRGYLLRGEVLPSTLRLYSEGMAAATRKITTNGLHRQYTRNTHYGSTVRGSVDPSQTVRQHHIYGRTHAAVSSSYERTFQTPLNQLVRTAVDALCMATTRCADELDRDERVTIFRALNEAALHLGQVHIDHRRTFLDDPVASGKESLPRGVAHYDDAARLSRAVLSRKGVALDQAGSEVVLAPMFLEMWRVFETYVRRVLQHHVIGDLRVLDGNVGGPAGARRESIFDDGTTNEATPDLVVERMINDVWTPVVVIDMKYKPLEAKPTRADIEQAVLYGQVYRTSTVMLIQPVEEPSKTGLRYLGTINGTQVLCYGIALGSSDIAAEEALLVGSVYSAAS